MMLMIYVYKLRYGTETMYRMNNKLYGSHELWKLWDLNAKTRKSHDLLSIF